MMTPATTAMAIIRVWKFTEGKAFVCKLEQSTEYIRHIYTFSGTHDIGKVVVSDTKTFLTQKSVYPNFLTIR